MDIKQSLAMALSTLDSLSVVGVENCAMVAGIAKTLQGVLQELNQQKKPNEKPEEEPQ